MKKLSPLLLAVLALLSCVEKPSSDLKSDNIIIDNPEYGSLQSLASPPITFELIQTFADNEDMDDELLANISSIFVDDNQNVYVLDSYSSKIISYSRSGEIRWLVDSPGKGPGDLTQPTGMIWNNSNLFYLSNLNGARIDVFNLKGEFIESLNLPDNKELFELVGYSNGNLVLANVIRGAFAKKFSIFDINDLSSAQTSFVVDVSGELMIPFTSTWFPQTALLEDHIVYGGVSEYEYNFIELDSTKGKIIQRDFDKIVRPGLFVDDEGSVIGALGAMSVPLKLSSDHYLTSSNWPVGVENPDAFIEGLVMGTITEYELESTIDLFDSNWNLLYSIESKDFEHPEYGTPQFVDSEGYLYSTFTEPFSHIKKFKLTIIE